VTPYGDYVDSGYVDSGYVFDPRVPVSLVSGGTRCDLRGPSGLSGAVRLLQPEEYSTGWERSGYAAPAIVHTMSLQYDRLFDSEVTDLLALRAAVDGSATPFTFSDPAQGLDFTCRFESPELNLEQPNYNINRCSLGLWSAATFFPLAAGVPVPDINAADTILTRLFNPTTQRFARKQPLLRFSDNTVAVFNKSAIDRTTRTVSLLRRTRDELAALIAFYTQSAQGTRYTFPWTFDGTGLTVRFASSTLGWKRSSINTRLFDVTVGLEEDTAI
jgi:hypothetical protein